MKLFKKINRRLFKIRMRFHNDKSYVICNFKKVLGYEPDLEHPKTLCEKLQWLKLNDRKDIYTTMADKYKVKEFAKSKGLTVIPLLGVYEKFNDIDFDKLPNQFVLKTNHTSGGYVICKDRKPK